MKKFTQLFITVLTFITAGAWSVSAWGNSVSSANSGDDVENGNIVMRGNHATFTFAASGTTISRGLTAYNLGSIDHGGTKTCTFTWSANSGCSIKVTKIEFGVRGYTSNIGRTGEMQATFNEETKSIGSVLTTLTTFSATNNNGFSSGIALTLKNTCGGHGLFSKSYDRFDYYLNDISITYTITPNAPTIKATTASVNVSLSANESDQMKLDMTDVIGVSDVNDFMPVSFESNSFSDPQGVSATGAYTFTGKYFYATKAGTYTFTKPYVAAKDYCHVASSKTNGSVTITVNRLDQTLTMKNGSVDVTTDKANPTTLDLSTLVNSHTGNGGVTYSLVSGPTSKTGDEAKDNCSISGNTFYAWVGGTYTLKATAAKTAQYNEVTSSNFTITVNRLTQTISWTPTNLETEPFVEEDEVTATSIGDVTLEKSGTGAEYVSLDGNKATVLEVGEASMVTLTATAAQTDVYAEATDSKTITLTSLAKQHITFDENLTKLKTTDGTKKKQLIATSDSGRDSYITFTVSSNTAGVTVTHEGDKWYLNYTGTAAKGIMVTAHLDGVPGTYVAASDVSQMVKVTDPTAVCDVTETLSSAYGLKSTSKTYDLTIPKKVVLKIRCSEKSRTLLQGYDIKFYKGNTQVGETQSYGITDGHYNNQDVKTRTFDNLDKDITKVVVTSNASKGYDITEASYERYSYANPSVSELNYEAYALSTVADQEFTVNYANYQIELSIEGSSNFVIKSDDSFGDCETYGSKTVTVGYNVPAVKCEESATLYIKDNAGNTLNMVTLNANVLGGLTQNITSTNIKTSYLTTDLINLTATTDRGLTNFTYTALPAGVASFDGNVMTFSQSGTIAITVTEAGNATFNEATATVENVVVSKVTPNITTNPTAGELTYLDKLSQSSVAQNGTAKVTLRGVANTEVDGSWAWTNSNYQVVEKPGSNSYSVTLTPSEDGMYTTATCSVAITVKKAAQTLTMNNGTVKVAVDGIDAGADDSKLDLDNLINVAATTADPVDANRAGVVSYEVISENKAKATIASGNIFSATEVGDYTIRATKAGTDYYNEKTADFKVTVEVRANTLAVTASYTKYVKEEIAPAATTINSDGEIHTSSDFPTIAYYDVANNKIVIPNSESDYQMFGDQKKVTIKIWQDATEQFTGIDEAHAKTIEVTVKKYDNPLTCSWGSWDKTVGFEKNVSTTFSTANSAPTLQVSQEGGEVFAEYYPLSNEIRSYHNVGDATWTIYQPEDYMYKAAGPETLTLHVRTEQEDGCFMYSADPDATASSVGEISLPEVGTAGVLTFKMKTNGAGYRARLTTVVGTQESTQEVAINSLGGAVSYIQMGPYNLDPNTTAIRFERGGYQLTGEYMDDPYINNIRISRVTWLKIQNVNKENISTLVMPTNTVNPNHANTRTAKFYVDYSTCADAIKVHSNHPRITVNVSEFDVEHIGRKEITVTYTSTAVEEISAKITVYTPYENEVLNVTAITEKENQSLIWQSGFEGANVSLPVSATVYTPATASSNNAVTYETDDPTVIEISEDKLSFKIIGLGTATLTAHAVGDETTWKPITEEKTITPTDKQIQIIAWDRTFTRLHENDEIDLDAVVKIQNYSDGTSVVNDARTALIHYSCPEDNGVITVDNEHRKLTVIGVGETTITASVDGDENYEAAVPVTLPVKVRAISTGDCDMPLMYLNTNETEIFAFDLAKPEISRTINIQHDYSSGDPDKLTFCVRGVAYKSTAISQEHFAGNIYVYESTDGGNTWGDALGVVEAESGKTKYTEAPIQLDPNTTHLKFVRPQGGEGRHYIGDIQITRLPNIKSEYPVVNALPEYDLGNVMAGAEHPDEVTFEYASVKGDLTISKSGSTNVLNELSITNSVDLECGDMGSEVLSFTFRPMVVGNWSENIVIQDPLAGLSTTIRVKATVTQGTQEIIWNTNTSLSAGQAPVLDAYSTVGLPVTYTLTCNNNEAAIVNDKVVIYKTGNFTITVNQAGNASFQEATLVKHFTVTSVAYTFTGTGDWNSGNNWDTGTTPVGDNPAVIVSGALEIDEDVTVGSLTIESTGSIAVITGGTLTVNGVSADRTEYGDLHVLDDGAIQLGNSADLQVRDFILDAKLGDDDHAAASGQVSGDDNLNVNRDAYFMMTFDVSGQITYGWYDFVVPFEVDAANGVYDANGVKIVYGTDYIIMSHSEEKRARNQKAWSTFTGTLQPGRIYTITFEETKTWNTFLFKKKNGANLVNSGTYTPDYSSTIGESQDRGWNGFGNGTLQHRELTDLTGISKVQMYNHTESRYDVIDNVDWITKALAVGTAFSIQVSSAQPVVLETLTDNKPLRAPGRETRTIEEFYLTLNESETEKTTDRLWVSASEDATGEYVIGHDLLKMGTPTQAKVAQMWTTRNNMQLCDAEMQLVGTKASAPLTLFAPKAGAYELEVQRAPKGASLFLTYNDRAIWNLSMSPYSMELSNGTTEGYGLRIIADRQTTTDIETISDERLEISGCRKVLIDNVLYVITPDGKMYDVVGKGVKF